MELPVGRTELVPVHEAAIQRFAALGFFADSPQTRPIDFVVRGHASASGEADGNVRLAQRRAETVAKALTGAGFRTTSVKVSGEGSSEPADPAPAGRPTRNRRVDVSRSSPPIEEPPVVLVPLGLGGARPPPASTSRGLRRSSLNALISGEL